MMPAVAALFMGYKAGPYAGSGDVVASPSSWWGLRAVTAASIGANCIKIRRSSDSTTKTFVTIAGGGINTSDVFLDGSNYFVDTLYDQIGTAHLVQATTANQPKLILGALGSKPVMRFVHASNLFLKTTTAPIISQPFTWSLVFLQNFLTTVDCRLISGTSTGDNIVLNDSQGAAANTLQIYGGGVIPTAVTCSDAAYHALQVLWNDSLTTIKVDSVAPVSSGVTATSGDGTYTLGGHPTISTLGFDGDCAEFGVWASGLSSGNQSLLNSNQHSYWGF
jgi:hypothetical protein